MTTEDTDEPGRAAGREVAAQSSQYASTAASNGTNKTVVDLVMDIVSSPQKTRHAAELLRIAGRFLAIYLICLLAMAVVLLLALGRGPVSIHMDLDRTMSRWTVGVSVAFVLASSTAISARFLRRKRKMQENERSDRKA
jgi:hypothetical protein